MKLSKKKVFALALAVCLIATLSMGSLAWFTDEDSVTNDFMVGDSDTPADEVFGVEVWEDRDTNGDGDYNEAEDAEKVDGLQYDSILPGQVLSKEPYLENTGIHPQFVRAIVTVTEADILKDAMIPKGADHSEWYDVSKFLPGTSDKWSLEYKYYTNKDTFVFVYYYTEVLEAGAMTEKIFTDVVIPTELTKEQAAEMEGFQITILGQAIQSEHLADPKNPGQMITTAKDAFATYWDEEGVVAGVNLEEDLGNGPVSVSYPVTGDLGTVNADLITYDPANYTDPDNPGVLIMSEVKANIKSGASLIVVPADQNNVSVIISDADFTVEDGGKIFECPHGTGMIYFHNVTINGEKLTRANLADMAAKYFTGYNTSNFSPF